MTEKVKADNIDKIIKGIPNKSYYLYIGRSTCPYCRKFWVFGFYGGKGLINHPSPNS